MIEDSQPQALQDAADMAATFANVTQPQVIKFRLVRTVLEEAIRNEKARIDFKGLLAPFRQAGLYVSPKADRLCTPLGREILILSPAALTELQLIFGVTVGKDGRFVKTETGELCLLSDKLRLDQPETIADYLHRRLVPNWGEVEADKAFAQANPFHPGSWPDWVKLKVV